MNRQQKSGITSRTDRRPARCRPQSSGIFDKSYLLNEEKSLLSNNGHVEDPRLQTSGMTPYLITETAQGFTPALVTPQGFYAGYSAGKQQGFTLIELLVVVLIIGILAAVALPQYQIAVEKARVAQILPLMRHIYDAYALYKLEHGSYITEQHEYPSLDELGIDLPGGFSGWPEIHSDDGTWDYCLPNEEWSGYVYCHNRKYDYYIYMFQPDDELYPDLRGKRVCYSSETMGIRICKALGGKEIESDSFGDHHFEF